MQSFNIESLADGVNMWARPATNGKVWKKVPGLRSDMYAGCPTDFSSLYYKPVFGEIPVAVRAVGLPENHSVALNWGFDTDALIIPVSGFNLCTGLSMVETEAMKLRVYEPGNVCPSCGKIALNLDRGCIICKRFFPGSNYLMTRMVDSMWCGLYQNRDVVTELVTTSNPNESLSRTANLGLLQSSIGLAVYTPKQPRIRAFVISDIGDLDDRLKIKFDDRVFVDAPSENVTKPSPIYLGLGNQSPFSTSVMEAEMFTSDWMLSGVVVLQMVTLPSWYAIHARGEATGAFAGLTPISGASPNQVNTLAHMDRDPFGRDRNK